MESCTQFKDDSSGAVLSRKKSGMREDMRDADFEPWTQPIEHFYTEFTEMFLDPKLG